MSTRPIGDPNRHLPSLEPVGRRLSRAANLQELEGVHGPNGSTDIHCLAPIRQCSDEGRG